jgi:hypothetical protein
MRAIFGGRTSIDSSRHRRCFFQFAALGLG